MFQTWELFQEQGKQNWKYYSSKNAVLLQEKWEIVWIRLIAYKQRIEALWSQFRRFITTYIINVFKTWTQETEYNSEDHLHKSCAWHCFGDVTQIALDNFRQQWNSHYIHRSRNVWSTRLNISSSEKWIFWSIIWCCTCRCQDHEIIFKRDKWKW